MFTILGDGRFEFNSRYKIDIGGDEPIEVSKLKLYKFDRTGTERDSNEGPSSSTNQTMDVVRYERFEPSSRENTPRTSITLEEAKREVAEALKEIWQLPETARSSAIKRLIRQWHPDKNQGREPLAAEVTQFLFNEVERLKGGGTPGYHPEETGRPAPETSQGRPTWDVPDFQAYFSGYGSRARRQRQQRYNGYNDETEPASRNEAKRWMRQAEIDFDAANCLFQNEDWRYYSLTCFHCQQAVEKALKALMFAKGCLKKTDLEVHDVMALAYRAAGLGQHFRGISVIVNRIHGYYIKTRYPEYTRGFSSESPIPAEIFTQEQASDALQKTGELFSIIRQALD